MGAQFINGERNPIYEIAHKLGVLQQLFPDLAHFDGATFYHGNCPVSRYFEFIISRSKFRDDIELFKEFVDPLDPKYRALAHRNDARSYNETLKSLYDRDYAEFLKVHLFEILVNDYILQNNSIESGFRRNVFDALSRPYRSYWEFEWASRWEDVRSKSLGV